MTIPVTSLAGAAAVTPAAFAAPTVTDKVDNPDTDVLLWVKIGATATTVTVVRPGTHGAGDNVADYVVVTGATATERIVRIGKEYADPADQGRATVLFSQVANVTALVLRA